MIFCHENGKATMTHRKDGNGKFSVVELTVIENSMTKICFWSPIVMKVA
jgi:hypothetical protein